MKTTAAILASVCLLTGAAVGQETELTVAEASFVDVDGNEIGTVTLTETEEGVTIAGTLEGIAEGEHGFHIHETGACDPATNFETAGSHFAPRGNEHGFDNPNGAHAGDMRNQTAGADGQLVLNVNNDMVSLTEGEEGYLLDKDGSALVVHSGPDDYSTDPSGNSGDRIACAVIEATEI